MYKHPDDLAESTQYRKSLHLRHRMIRNPVPEVIRNAGKKPRAPKKKKSVSMQAVLDYMREQDVQYAEAVRRLEEMK